MQLSKCHGNVVKQETGFTMFEMVVVIVLVCILYSVAGGRMADLPASAERVSFYGVLSQLKTAANFKMIELVTAGKKSELDALDGANPMDFLIEQPGNYAGEVEKIDEINPRQRQWYFESSSGQLIYIVSDASFDNVSVTLPAELINNDQIHLKLLNIYHNSVDNSGALGRRWEGLLIEPVYPYLWLKNSQTLEEIEAAQLSSAIEVSR